MDSTELQLSRFAEFLLHRQLVREKAAPYMVRWVRRFLSNPPVNEGSTIHEMALSYVEQLRADNQYEEWQLRQAEQALRLYFHNFILHNSILSA